MSDIVSAYGIPHAFLNDDVFIVGLLYDECLARLHLALQLFAEMGWVVSEDKVDLPSQCLPFRGVVIDTCLSRLSIPLAKLSPILRLVSSTLSAGSIQVRSLWSLLGRLSWVASVMLSGRAYLKFLWELGPASLPRHYVVRLSRSARRDLEWWARRLQRFSGHVRT